MIDQALTLIINALNAYLKSDALTTEKVVSLSGIYDANGEPLEMKFNHLILSVGNIDVESMNQSKRGVYGGGVEANTDAPLIIDIQTVLVSNFYAETYKDGLKRLSQAISFFHKNPLFTIKNYPAMPAGIDKIFVEIIAPEHSTMGNSAHFLSQAHKPYVCYNIKVVCS